MGVVKDEAPRAYTIFDDSSVYERMFYIFHRLGIQSNLVVSARYSSEKYSLDKDTISAALRAVVSAHPALRQVFVRAPSSRSGHHDLKKANLDEIDLEACIHFEPDDGKDLDSSFMERQHNQWEWVGEEPTKPWWKLVVKGDEMAFVYHHSIGDGLSGYIFHREFLSALNKMEWPQSKPPPTTVRILRNQDCANKDAPRDPLRVTKLKFSWWELIVYNLTNVLLDLFFRRSIMYNSLPLSKACVRVFNKPVEPASRTVTHISSYRIPSARMAQILKACRANNVTFTPLLVTMMTLTLASDHFPEAKIGVSRYAFDLRPFLDMGELGGSTPSGTMTNASAGGHHVHWLNKFRDADQGLNAKEVDTAKVWNLVKSYKRGMDATRHGVGTRLWTAGELMGVSLEDFVDRAFGSLNKALPPTHHVSNLGPFVPPTTDDGEKQESAPWAITDSQFSVGATNGTLGTHGIILSVAGVRGGDTVINASYEQGVVERDMADDVLRGIGDRIEALVEASL